MSTSIDGIYFEHSSIDEILDSIEFIKADFQKDLKGKYLKDISEYIIKDFINILFANKKTENLIFISKNTRNTLKPEDVKHIEENNLIFWHSLKFKQETAKEKSDKDFLYTRKNYYFNILFLRQNLTKLAPKYLGILNTNNSNMINEILKHDKIKDYSYYDASDGQVEEIGYKNWRRRGRNWDRLLPSGDFEKNKSLKLEIADTSDIVLDTDKKEILDYIKVNIEHLFEKEIKEHIINVSYNQYMLDKELDPTDAQQVKFSQVMLMEQASIKLEKDKTYIPKDKEEKELLGYYKQMSEKIIKKANILLSYDLIKFINLPLSELYITKQKLDIENNINIKKDNKINKKHL